MPSSTTVTLTLSREALETRLHDLRTTRNRIERTMSLLRPADDSPNSLREWEDAMGDLARMHAGIGDLFRKIEKQA